MKTDTSVNILKDVKNCLITSNNENILNEKIAKYLKETKNDLKLFNVIKNIQNLIAHKHLYEAREYIQLEINNMDGTTEKNCKNTIYHFYGTYCKYCSNMNCPSNKNTG